MFDTVHPPTCERVGLPDETGDHVHSLARISRSLTTRALLTSALLLAALGIAAAQTPASAATSEGADAVVVLDKGAVSVPGNGAFDFKVNIKVDRPTSYLESRVQIRRPSGKLLYQKTEVRSGLSTGTVTLDYARQLGDLDLKPGAYPIEVRVRTQANGVREWTLEDDLLVYSAGTSPTPVLVIACIEAAPARDAQGRFTVDPAISTRARDEAEQVARFVISDTDARIALAVPPILLEEWLRASQGYDLTTPDGVVSVSENDAVPRRYAEVLEVLRAAIATGRLELLDVPYASPDVGALARGGRLDDLEAQLLRGQSAYLASTETSPSSVAYLHGGACSPDALEMLSAHMLDACVIDPSSLASAEETPSTGAYRSGPAKGPALLLLDPRAGNALASGETTTFVRSVFDRTISQEPSAPVIASVVLGPGRSSSAADLASCIASLTSAPWAELSTSSAIVAVATGTIEPSSVPPRVAGAPTGYWDEVFDASNYAAALLEAAGANDPEAGQASDDALAAESALWAGPDLNWGPADRGRALASAAKRIAGGILDTVKVSAPDITLSGSSGKVPVSITNGSDKNLQLTVSAAGTGLTVLPRDAESITVRPQENITEIPVDLGQSLSGRLTVEVRAGDLMLDRVDVDVRASVLDRLVMIGGALVVLIGMLLFIRHRVRSTSHTDTPRAGTM